MLYTQHFTLVPPKNKCYQMFSRLYCLSRAVALKPWHALTAPGGLAVPQGFRFTRSADPDDGTCWSGVHSQHTWAIWSSGKWELWARPDISKLLPLHLLVLLSQSQADSVEVPWEERYCSCLPVPCLLLLSLPWPQDSLAVSFQLLELLELSLNKCAASGDGIYIPQTSFIDFPI